MPPRTIKDAGIKKGVNIIPLKKNWRDDSNQLWTFSTKRNTGVTNNMKAIENFANIGLLHQQKSIPYETFKNQDILNGYKTTSDYREHSSTNAVVDLTQLDMVSRAALVRMKHFLPSDITSGFRFKTENGYIKPDQLAVGIDKWTLSDFIGTNKLKKPSFTQNSIDIDVDRTGSMNAHRVSIADKVIPNTHPHQLDTRRFYYNPSASRGKRSSNESGGSGDDAAAAAAAVADEPGDTDDDGDDDDDDGDDDDDDDDARLIRNANRFQALSGLMGSNERKEEEENTMDISQRSEGTRRLVSNIFGALDDALVEEELEQESGLQSSVLGGRPEEITYSDQPNDEVLTHAPVSASQPVRRPYLSPVTVTHRMGGPTPQHKRRRRAHREGSRGKRASSIPPPQRSASSSTPSVPP